MSKRLAGWTVVFDLDGTLVESAPDLLNALNHTIAPLGVSPVQLGDIRTMIGHGAKAMIRQSLDLSDRQLSANEMDRLWTDFIDYYRANIAVDSFVFEGVEAALDALADEGATLSVCTNKTQGLSEILLNELNLAHRFSTIVGADSVKAKKPDAAHVFASIERVGGELGRSVFVGDSRTDEKAAQNAGLPFIFVPFGYEAAPAEAISYSAILRHYSELLEHVLAVAG